MSQLSNLNKASQFDDFDDGAPTETELVAAPVAAISEASGKRRIGLGGLRGTTDSKVASFAEDEDDAAWDDVADRISADGVGTHEPVAAKTSVEDALNDIVPDGPVVSDELVDADKDADEKKPEDEDALDPDIDQDDVLHVSAPRIDFGGYRDQLSRMLQLQLGEAEADVMAQQAVQELNALDEKIKAEALKIDEDEAALRERQEAARNEVVEQVGGGILSSLMGRMFSSPAQNFAREMEGFGRARRRLRDESTSSYSAMRDRISDHMHRDTNKRILSMGAHMQDVDQSIREYNATVLNSDAARGVVDLVRRHAGETGENFDDIVAKIANRKASDEILNAFDSAQENIFSDAAVAKARAEMERRREVLNKDVGDIKKRIESLVENGKVDVAETQKKFFDAFEEGIEKWPDPIEEAQKAEEFKKRMREMIESIKTSIQALFSRLMHAAP